MIWSLSGWQLLEVEGKPPPPDFAGYTEEQQVYHMALCIEAGLVDGVVVPNPSLGTRLRHRRFG